MARFVALAAPALALSFAVACEDGRPVADLGQLDGGAGGEAPECEDGPGYGEPTEQRLVTTLTATLVDSDDNPVPNELVQLCGLDICINGESDAVGDVLIATDQPMLKPAFKFGEGRVSARFAWLVPDEGEEVDLGAVRTVLLPPLGEGEALVPGALASSGGLSLLPASNAAIEVDRLTFQEPDERLLRAVRVPLDRAPAVVDPVLGFELVYAATPTETTFCPPAVLRVENTEGWDPGAAVEVWLHGVDITEEWAPYGGWAKVSDAEVSEDGSVIETTSPGLPVLGVIGLKRP